MLAVDYRPKQAPRSPLPTSWAVWLVAAASLGIALAGCGSGSTATPASTPATSTSSAPSSSTAPVNAAPAAPAPTVIPSPDASETAKLVSDLGAIDPSLADKKAVSRARNVCQKSAPGEYPNADGLSNYVQQEFQDGDTPTVSASTADAIIAAVKASSWCKQ